MLNVIADNLSIPQLETVVNSIVGLAKALRSKRILRDRRAKHATAGSARKFPVAYRSTFHDAEAKMFGKPFCAELHLAVAPGKSVLFATAEKSIMRTNSNGRLDTTTWVEDRTLIEPVYINCKRSFESSLSVSVEVCYHLLSFTTPGQGVFHRARELAVELHSKLEEELLARPELEAQLTVPPAARLVDIAVSLMSVANKNCWFGNEQGKVTGTFFMDPALTGSALLLGVSDQFRRSNGKLRVWRGKYDVNSEVVTEELELSLFNRSEYPAKSFPFEKIWKSLKNGPELLEKVLSALVATAIEKRPRFVQAAQEEREERQGINNAQVIVSVARLLFVELGKAWNSFSESDNQRYNKVEKGSRYTGIQLTMFFTRSGALAYSFGCYQRARQNKDYYYPEKWLVLRQGWINAENKEPEECQPIHAEIVLFPAISAKSKWQNGDPKRLQEWAIVHFLIRGMAQPGVAVQGVPHVTNHPESEWIFGFAPGSSHDPSAKLKLPPGIRGASDVARYMFVPRGYRP